MPGVNVVVKGATIGAITGADGKYSITVPDKNVALVFSFIGYGTQEVLVAGKSVIDVALVSESKALEEVVVIGYGTQKKSDLTGSVVRVNMTDKVLVNNVNLLQSIQGDTPGLNVTGGGALAGDEPSLSIRGQTSLSASDAPLIVLDGIIYNGSISDINVNDVETIDILKDASAAAVYGSRSANGVMLVTTKKGKTDKPRFTLNSTYGFQNFTKDLPVMNAEQYAVRLVDYYWEQQLYAWYKTNPTDATGRPVRPDVTDRNVVAVTLRSQEEKDNYLAGGHDIDWIDEVSRIAPMQNYDLNFSGKTDRSNYYISGSYTDQDGVLLNDQFKRTTVHTNIESKVTDWLTLGLTSSYSYRDYSGLEASLSAARSASPFASMYNAIGEYPLYLVGELYQPHPFNRLTVPNKDLRNNLFVIVSAKIVVPKITGLVYDFNYSNTYNTTKNNTFWPVTVPEGMNNNGLATKALTEERSWIYNNILTYARTFGNVHSVNATFLYSREYRSGESTNPQAQGFSNPALIYNGMQNGTVPALSTGAWEEKSISYMGRVNYTFKDRYMITGTVRKDGFSGFGPNNKFATFPSLSLGWVASEEPFVKNVKWLNFLKLRASVGVNGNQGIGRYSSFAKMSSTSYVYGATTAIAVYPSSLGNSDLGWESTLSYNLGLDYAVLDSRISGSIDVYKAKTSNVLVSRALPPATGYASVWANIGEISNDGIELGLTTVNIKGQLRWETKFQFSLNRDKITKLYGGANDKDIGNSWFVGKPISAI
jgi:TonB-linked SusC/RagA family outer membrane protein